MGSIDRETAKTAVRQGPVPLDVAFRCAETALSLGSKQEREQALSALHDAAKASGSMFRMDCFAPFKSYEMRLLISTGRTEEALKKSIKLLGFGTGRLAEIGSQGFVAAQKAQLQKIGDGSILTAIPATTRFIEGIERALDAGGKLDTEGKRNLALTLYQVLESARSISSSAGSLARGIVEGDRFRDRITQLGEDGGIPEIGTAVRKLLTGNPRDVSEPLHRLAERLGKNAPAVAIKELTLQAAAASPAHGLEMLRILARDLEKIAPASLQLRASVGSVLTTQYYSSLTEEERKRELSTASRATGATPEKAARDFQAQRDKLDSEAWWAVGRAAAEVGQSIGMAFATGMGVRNTRPGLPKLVFRTSELSPEIRENLSRVAGLDPVGRAKARSAALGRTTSVSGASPAFADMSAESVATLRGVVATSRLPARSSATIERSLTKLMQLDTLHGLSAEGRALLREGMTVLSGSGDGPPTAGQVRVLRNNLETHFRKIDPKNARESEAVSTLIQLTGELTFLVERPQYQTSLGDVAKVVQRHYQGVQKMDLSRARQLQEQLSNQLEIFLLENKPLDHGNYGLVFQIDPAKVAPQFRSVLNDLFPSSSPHALKLLKITNTAAAEAEGVMQAEAREIVLRASQGKEGSFAQVPAVRRLGGISGWADLTWSGFTVRNPKVVEQLPGTVMGSQPNLSPDGGREWKLSGILMEWIPGQSLGRILMNRANQFLGTDKIDEQYMQFGDLAHKTLAANGVGVNPRIIAQMEASLKALNQSSIAHGDGHLRNWIIVGPPQAIFDRSGKHEVSVFLIDFGASTRAVSPERARALDTESWSHLGRLRRLNNGWPKEK